MLAEGTPPLVPTRPPMPHGHAGSCMLVVNRQVNPTKNVSAYATISLRRIPKSLGRLAAHELLPQLHHWQVAFGLVVEGTPLRPGSTAPRRRGPPRP